MGFWDRIDVDRGGCWIWTGYTMPNGYGQVWYRGKVCLAHRVSYEMQNGPIPPRMVLDHLCRNRACANPSHLEVVTRGENLRRGIGPVHCTSKTHCPHGHEYTPENTHLYKNRRVCKACWKRYYRAVTKPNRSGQ